MRATAGIALASIVAAGGLAAPLRAGPPYVTDDPEPTDTGKWENYGFVAGTGVARGIVGSAGFDINYGAAPRLQASVVIGLDYRRDRGARLQAGIADTEIGLKYKLLDRARDGAPVDLAIFPKLDLPTAGRRFGSGRVGAQVPVWAERDLGAWSLFGGGGLAINPGRGNRDFGFAGIAVTRRVTSALSLGGEAYTQGADTVGGRSTAGLGLGATWAVAGHWSIIGSGGPIVAHSDTTGRYAFYVALEYRN
jgi:hypothetical protein